LRSVVAAVRVTSDSALSDGPDAERESFLLRSLYGAPFSGARGFRLHATLEVADAEALGGDFTFRRFIGDVRGRRPLGGPWALAARGLLGLSGGTLPLQKRFALGGVGTLRGFRIKELGGDNMALAAVEVQREARFPRPGVAVFSDLGTAWSRDVDGSGIEVDAGAGLFWTGPGGFHVRVDAAVPVTPSEGRHHLRVTVRLQPPF
jgi:hemolysin activation/secretion protein